MREWQRCIWILTSYPWNIDGNHLILKHWSQGSLTKEFDFPKLHFIKVHNLPFEYFFSAKKCKAHQIQNREIGWNRSATKWVPIKYMWMKVFVFLMDWRITNDAWIEKCFCFLFLCFYRNKSLFTWVQI